MPYKCPLTMVNFIRSKPLQTLRSQKRASCIKHLARNLIKKPISGCVCMGSLLTTSPLQVVKKVLQLDCLDLLFTGLLQVALFQHVATSAQMTSCNMPDFNLTYCKLTCCNKPIKLTTCNKSEAFFVVYGEGYIS